MQKCRLFIGYKQNECQIFKILSIFYNTHYFNPYYHYISIVFYANYLIYIETYEN